MEQETERVVSKQRRPIRQLAAMVVDGRDLGKRAFSEGETLTIGTAESNTLQLDDPTVSRFHIRVDRIGSRIRVADSQSTNGSRIGPVALQGESCSAHLPCRVQCGESVIELSDGEATFEHYEDDPGLAAWIIGSSTAVRRLRGEIARVAPSDASVLVLGETGTGKELIARAIHERSGRQGRLVVFDCGSIAPNLLASELFGHEKGAFTGATRQHFGALEQADGGTLFLDEVGELPLELQPALLGALERRSFRRVGGAEEQRVDVRVVAATHADLRAKVNTGAFRLDLYHRLEVVALEAPPLRERAKDIPALIEHFLDLAGAPPQTPFDRQTVERLSLRDWPGNIRELRNVVEATLALGEVPASTTRDAPEFEDDVDPLRFRDAKAIVVRKFEADFLARLMARSSSIREAARLADMDRGHLTQLLEKHGLVKR